MSTMRMPQLKYYNFGEDVTAFSTMRQGGYSKGNFGEFNINRYCGDSEEAIRKNREALCRLLAISDDHLLMPHQVHLTEMTIVDETFLSKTADERQQALEGVDALMTNIKEVCIGVSTADCIPVLLHDPVHHAGCAIHAGWRGTVQRIVEKAVDKMQTVYGTQPADILAQIGPGISLDSFEVGDEVYDVFAHEAFDMEQISKRYEKWHIDLPLCNRLHLLSMGLSTNHISCADICTVKQHDTYFSARRLGIHSGRIFSAIILH